MTTTRVDPFNLPVYTFDLTAPMRLLDDISATLDDIDGVKTELDPDAGPQRDALANANDKERRKEIRSRNAGYSRDLLRAAARARTLAAEIEEVYWALKGHEDVRAS